MNFLKPTIYSIVKKCQSWMPSLGLFRRIQAHWKTRKVASFFPAFLRRPKKLFAKPKNLLIVTAVVLAFFLIGQTAIGQQINLPAGLIEAVRNFFAGHPNLSAADYKDGTIILIKPVATGVGEGRLEAGDIVEIRDGTALYERFGDGDFLGSKEKTNLLPVYYPGKLTEEQKNDLIASEKKIIKTTEEGKTQKETVKRRKVGIDYTKFLSDPEIIKVRQFEKLDKIPEIDLLPIIQKTSEQKSVVQIPQYLAGIENTKNTLNKIIRKIIPFALAGSGTKTICSSGCDYTTLNGWEGTEQANLTGTGPAIAQITGGFLDTAAVDVTGWTTTATDYIRIYTTPAARHNGTRSPDKYRLIGSAGELLLAGTDYARYEGLQVSNTSGSAESSATINNIGVRITDTLIYDTGGSGYGLQVWAGTIYANNLVLMNNGGSGLYLNNWSTVNFYAYNSVAVNNGGYGFYIATGQYLACKNCYAGGNASADYGGSVAITTSYSEDGTNSTPTAAWSISSGGYFNNVTAGSEDIHIGSASTLKDAGTDLSTDSYWIEPDGSVDIDGDARSGTWDVGADEWSMSIPATFRGQVRMRGEVRIKAGGMAAPAWACGDSVQGVGGLTYGSVTGEDGECWMDRNLGAPDVALNYYDESSYGYLYQWGRLNDNHQYTVWAGGALSGTTTTQSSGDVPGHANFINSHTEWRSTQNNDLWGDASRTNNPCPTDWHVPTQTEWSTWTTAAHLTTAECSGGSQCLVVAASSNLKLPAAGYRNWSTASPGSQGSNGFYWSTSPLDPRAYNFEFSSGSVSTVGNSDRANGLSVRCIKD